MNKIILITAGFLGAIAISLGAFGAHALKKVLTITQLVTFETGVRYQMYHALFLLCISLIPALTEKSKKVIFILILGGVLLFSGSIYILSTKDLTSLNFKLIGVLTPIGGFLLISGWCYFCLSIFNKKHNF